MQILGTKTIREKIAVELDIQDVFHALAMELRRRYCIPSDAYLDPETGNMVCAERNWRHGSQGTDVLEIAPHPDKVAVLEALSDMAHVIKHSKE